MASSLINMHDQSPANLRLGFQCVQPEDYAYSNIFGSSQKTYVVASLWQYCGTSFLPKKRNTHVSSEFAAPGCYQNGSVHN